MHLHRRSLLKAMGSTGVTLGGVGSVGARTESATTTCVNMEMVSDVDQVGTTEHVVQGNYIYVAVRGTARKGGERQDPVIPGLAVFDWRNPNTPNRVAKLDAPEQWHPEGTQDVKVNGNLATLCGDDGPGVLLIDVSDPANPEFVGRYIINQPVHDTFLYEDLMFLTASPENGPVGNIMQIVDVSDPTDPVLLGEYDVANHYPDLVDAGGVFIHDMFVQNDLAHMAYWNAGNVIADVSDPANPVNVSQMGASVDGFQGNAHYSRPTPDGDTVFVGAETGCGDVPPGGIEVFDITDVENPQFLTRIDAPSYSTTLRTSHNFDVTQNRLYSSWYGGGVRVHDITDPANPQQIGCYDPDDKSSYWCGGFDFAAWHAVSARGHVVASDIERGIKIFKNVNHSAHSNSHA